MIDDDDGDTLDEVDHAGRVNREKARGNNAGNKLLRGIFEASVGGQVERCRPNLGWKIIIIKSVPAETQ